MSLLSVGRVPAGGCLVRLVRLEHQLLAEERLLAYAFDRGVEANRAGGQRFGSLDSSMEH